MGMAAVVSAVMDPTAFTADNHRACTDGQNPDRRWRNNGHGMMVPCGNDHTAGDGACSNGGDGEARNPAPDGVVEILHTPVGKLPRRGVAFFFNIPSLI